MTQMKTISDKRKFCLGMFVIEMYIILTHKNFPKFYPLFEAPLYVLMAKIKF